MRKVILSIIVAFCALGLSAQDWSLGGRIGSGLQVVGQYHGIETGGSNPFYLEGRFGMSWCNSGADIMADFTLLAAWNCFNFGYNSAGRFFSDFGVGLNVGGRKHYCYVGPCGLARIGFNFARPHLSLAADWTPVFGPEIAKVRASDFYGYGLCNFAVTLMYNF